MDDSHSGGGDPPLPEGEVIGDYRVVRAIGAGSFGTVYEGLHPLIGKRVAIKVLARRYSSDAEAVSRFIAEARVVNEIRHRNIVDIFSFNQLPDGRQYFVMEFLDGPTLEALLADRGRLPPQEALPLLREVASALDAAHRMGVAHRDIKPANVMVVSDQGRPSAKLIDFGLAKLSKPEIQLAHETKTGSLMGTPKYMSPEQCRSKPADQRSDVYSFGLIAYEMLTGSPPFHGKDSFDYMLHHTRSAPPPPRQVNPGLHAGFDGVILSTLEKDPERRPTELVPLVQHLEGLVGAGPAAGPVRGPRRAAVAAAAIVILAAFAWALTREPPAAPALPPAAAAAPAPPAVEPAAAPPAPPALVEIRLEGLAGAEVRADDGSVLGKVPGTIRLPRGDRQVRLEASLEGFETKSYALVPAGDQPMVVELARKRAAPRPRKPAKSSELEKVF